MPGIPPAPARGKLFIKTHGCQMNEYDSARMADVLAAEHGLELTQDETEADVILVNTCSIREKAQEKVFSQLGRWKQLKKDKPVLIGVGGCVASQEGEAILKRAPFVDLVFGPQTLHRLPDLIEARRESGQAQVDVSFPEIEKFDRMPEPRAEGPTAFVSIIEGCSKYCSFCVVPYTRGEEVSRPFDDVLLEVAQLAAQGVREIHLLGQNVNAYRGRIGDGPEIADLATLIRAIATIDGVGRIRYTTSHPLEFSDALIEAHRDVPQLAAFLHLPVQSGSDRILAAMKRNHTALEYKARIRKLRAAKPDIVISSDFIVGFPGETERDFEQTLKLVEEIGFDQSFSFAYSRRPGTPAANLHDEVPHAVALERLQRLQAAINANARRISEAMLGTVQRVLVEGPSARNPDELTGKTENMRNVNFAGQARLIGQFVDLRITEVRTNSLRGEVVTVDEAVAA
jgi:tRNA-2-methylthio-N6-dimethylallyladenosine synthase